MNILVLGGLVADQYYHIDGYPIKGGDGYITDTTIYAGGCALNMAATIKNLGGIPYVISRVGSDSTGDFLVNYLKQHQLPIDGISVVSEDTGYCMVFVTPDGERTFLTKKGCEAGFNQAMIPNIDWDGCSVTGYYLLEEDSKEIVATVKSLKEAGVPILFDPGPLVNKIKPQILEDMICVSSIITPNISELDVLRGNQPEGQWLSKICAKGVTVVVKNGAKGGQIYTSKGSISYKAKEVTSVDTTGAGDSFAGALIWAMAKSMSIEESVDLATLWGGKAASFYGPHQID